MALRARLRKIALENPEFRQAMVREMQRIAITWPRRSYLPPEARDDKPFVPPGTDLEIWTWDKDGKPYGVAFAGKSNKPLWLYRFQNESRRQQEVDATIRRRKEQIDEKVRRQKERREFQHGLEPGTLLYSSWGYDQTNVDFYQVTKVVGKQVEIRKVEKKVVRDSGPQVYVAPVPNRFTGPPKRKTPQKGGGRDGAYVKLDHNYAYIWDGKPKYETGFGYGH